jgi:hypothetical protein
VTRDGCEIRLRPIRPEEEAAAPCNQSRQTVDRIKVGREATQRVRTARMGRTFEQLLEAAMRLQAPGNFEVTLAEGMTLK